LQKVKRKVNKSMNYKITLIVEDENEFKVFSMSTSAGLPDFEENIIRKAEKAIKDYESEAEAREQAEIERQKEEAEIDAKKDFIEDINAMVDRDKTVEMEEE